MSLEERCKRDLLALKSLGNQRILHPWTSMMYKSVNILSTDFNDL